MTRTADCSGVPRVCSRVEESEATLSPKSRAFLLCAGHANQSVCGSLVADRQGGRDQRGSCQCNCVTLSESDTSSIQCIFLAPAQHA